MSTKPHDGTVGDMMRELRELREALAKANAAIEANSNTGASFVPERIVLHKIARRLALPDDAGSQELLVALDKLTTERDAARDALVDIAQRYVAAEARAAQVPPELAEQFGQAAREVIVKDTPLEEPPLTDDQIQAAIAKGKADRAKLEAAGWQHGILPERPPYCHGQCVNAPEGEPPLQRTFNMVCAGCVREMDRVTEKVIDEKARADVLAVSLHHEPVEFDENGVAPPLKITDASVVRMDQAASDTADPAYWRGSDDGVNGTLRALAGILDGPLDARPSFGGAELQAMAERLLAMRAELDAVHGDLGKAHEELGAARESQQGALRSLSRVMQAIREHSADPMKLVAAVTAEVAGADLADAADVAWNARLARAQDRISELESDLADADQVTQDALGHARAASEGKLAVLEARMTKVLEMIVDFALAGRSKLDGRSMEHALIQIQHAAEAAMAKPPPGEKP